MVLSLVVVAAASGVYLATSSAFTSVDSSSQLQDSARFATYILRRTVQQIGYEDYTASSAGYSRSSELVASAALPTCVQSDICGFNNRAMTVDDVIANSPGTTGTLTGGFYSDTLIARFQGQGAQVLSPTTRTRSPPSTTVGDGSMIDCGGNSVASNDEASRTSRAMSALYVGVNSVTGEPELYCSSLSYASSAAGAGRPPVPLVKGVEVFKVMYEVGNDTADSSGVSDGGLDVYRWVRADQVAGLALTNASERADGTKRVNDAVNAWRNVVSVRFGLVIRGDIGSAPLPATAQTLFPLGAEFAVTGDPATTYVPPIDTRLRRVVTFTINIRNTQNAFFTTPKPATSP